MKFDPKSTQKKHHAPNKRGKSIPPKIQTKNIQATGPLKGWQVLPNQAGMRLPNFIAEKLGASENLSLRQIKTLLEKGCCKVNGKTEKFASRKVEVGEVVSFVFSKELLEPIKEKFSISRSAIIFEDEYLIAYDKPTGLACGPMDHDEENNLRVYLENFLNGQNLIMVHRLDKDTSGIILYAKTSEVAEKLLAMFKDRAMQKTYEVLVDGIVESDDGSIDKKMFLKSKGQGFEKWGVTKGEAGKTAITRYQKIKEIGKVATLLEVKPLTGRTHQIRVHFESIGHPVLGDQFYGQNFQCQIVFSGHLLHARALHFKHPITGENLTLRTNKPQRFILAEQKILGLNK